MLIVLILLAVLVIITLKGIFSALSIAGELDESLLGPSSPRVNKTAIDEALGSIKSRKFTPLDL